MSNKKTRPLQTGLGFMKKFIFQNIRLNTYNATTSIAIATSE